MLLESTGICGQITMRRLSGEPVLLESTGICGRIRMDNSAIQGEAGARQDTARALPYY